MLNDQSITSPHSESQKIIGFIQKQTPALFCKMFQKFRRKTPVLESPYNKTATLLKTLLKRDSNTDILLSNLRTSAKGCFYLIHLRII